MTITTHFYSIIPLNSWILHYFGKFIIYIYIYSTLVFLLYFPLQISCRFYHLSFTSIYHLCFGYNSNIFYFAFFELFQELISGYFLESVLLIDSRLVLPLLLDSRIFIESSTFSYNQFHSDQIQENAYSGCNLFFHSYLIKPFLVQVYAP